MQPGQPDLKAEVGPTGLSPVPPGLLVRLDFKVSPEQLDLKVIHGTASNTGATGPTGPKGDHRGNWVDWIYRSHRTNKVNMLYRTSR